MGEVINVDFKKKSKKKRKSSTLDVLDFPMIFHEAGWGINPNLLQKIQVSQTGTVFFYFTKTGGEPQAALYTPSYVAACDAAEQLQQCILQEHGIEVKVIYD